WRAQEYAKLASLKAGFPIAKFNEVLGEPVFVMPWGPNTTQEIYRGRDYWVRVLKDERNNVKQFAVTSCSTTFRPTFVLYPLANLHVTLQRSRMRSVLGNASRIDAKVVNGAHTLQLYDT